MCGALTKRAVKKVRCVALYGGANKAEQVERILGPHSITSTALSRSLSLSLSVYPVFLAVCSLFARLFLCPSCYAILYDTLQVQLQ